MFLVKVIVKEEVFSSQFRPDALPPHFAMNYKLIDEHGRQLDMKRSLVALRREWGKEAREEFAELHETPSEYTNLTDWTFGELPELMEVPVGQQTVIGYPALVDDGESVSLKVFDSAGEAAGTHRKGLLRLFMIQFREQAKYFDKNVPGITQMGMQFMALGTTEELKRQIVELTFARACLAEPLPTTPEAFKARCAEAKARLGLIMREVCRLVGGGLTSTAVGAALWWITPFTPLEAGLIASSYISRACVCSRWIYRKAD